MMLIAFFIIGLAIGFFAGYDLGKTMANMGKTTKRTRKTQT